MALTPGTPEFVEQQGRQGQAAMDAALAHPVARVFLGALFLVVLLFSFLIYEEVFFGQEPLWRNLLTAISMPLILGPILMELGSVALFGRSITPWYGALMRRWRPKA